jgi:hypothetical protein
LLAHTSGFIFKRLVLFICLLLCSRFVFGQSPSTTGAAGQPATLANAPQRDTNANKSNNSKWIDLEARIHYVKLNSEVIHTPDTSLHTFDRRPFLQPWYRDLGNLGSPASSLLFTPEDRLGPTLGYHTFDIYRFFPDSLNYYNTTRPYSAFTYQLGSKLEQIAEVMHTQNITPDWNFSLDYRKLTSPGFFLVQRNNDDNANFTTNYKSKNQHYRIFGALVYNKEQNDENGGIQSAAQLDSAQYGDHKTIPVQYENNTYSLLRSSVTNNNRDFTMMIQQSYTWGIADTTYNADSTQYTARLIPRFSVSHKLELSSEKHEYKDIGPDSLRYISLFQHSFPNQGLVGQGDSVLMQQKWFWIDNNISLNGFLGTDQKQLKFSAGVGNRIDQFTTAYAIGNNENTIISNYVIAELKKEALQPGQWFYQANGKFFLTGADAGDFLLHASLGKDLKGDWATFAAGFQQQLNSAPYNYTIYENQYYKWDTTFNKESITQVYGTLQSKRLRFAAGIRNYLIDNYLYVDQYGRSDQYTKPFNITQIWVNKSFRYGMFILDNDLVYQQSTAGAPVNIPAILGRHRLSVETAMFKTALKIAAGVEIRYNTAYFAPGYDPLLSRFYYQNSDFVANAPEGSVFFNFRIKRFRAYIMGDQLQELITRNAINYPGYPAQDAMIRFGFTWVMIN